jgi:hypothetical protein
VKRPIHRLPAKTWGLHPGEPTPIWAETWPRWDKPRRSLTKILAGK